MAGNIPSIGTTNIAALNRPSGAGATTPTQTAATQTGFDARSAFNSAVQNFAALGSPDQAGSGLQQLTQVVEALSKIVEALGGLIQSLKGGAAGGAESAQGKPAEGGQTTPTPDAQRKEAAPAGGGAEGAQTTPTPDAQRKEAAPAGGGAENAGAAGGKDLLSTITNLVSALAALIQQLMDQEEAKKGEAAKGKGKKGGGGEHQTHASENAKKHAAPNSAVGQQAAMEALNQAITQILTTLLQALGPMIQQLAGQAGGEQGAQIAAQTGDILKNIGGGGAAGGVVMKQAF